MTELRGIPNCVKCFANEVSWRNSLPRYFWVAETLTLGYALHKAMGVSYPNENSAAALRRITSQ